MIVCKVTTHLQTSLPIGGVLLVCDTNAKGYNNGFVVKCCPGQQSFEKSCSRGALSYLLVVEGCPVCGVMRCVAVTDSPACAQPDEYFISCSNCRSCKQDTHVPLSVPLYLHDMIANGAENRTKCAVMAVVTGMLTQ